MKTIEQIPVPGGWIDDWNGFIDGGGGGGFIDGWGGITGDWPDD